MSDIISAADADILNRMNADAQKIGLGAKLVLLEEEAKKVGADTLGAFTGNWGASKYTGKTLLQVLGQTDPDVLAATTVVDLLDAIDKRLAAIEVLFADWAESDYKEGTVAGALDVIAGDG